MKHAAVPSSLRKMNRRLILRHMVQVPSAARAELAEVAGTSCVTAGKIVDELLDQGVLEPTEFKREGNKPGRPGQGLRLNVNEPRFLLVQLGVDRTRFAYAPLGVSEDSKWAAEIETPGSAKEWEQAVRHAIDAMKPREVWGTLVSVPGITDEARGRVLYSPNLHWSEGVDFKGTLRAMINAPVELVHEIRALALGHQSATPGETDFLLVDIGHGVGGAAVVHGSLYQGPLPMSGELGHTPVLDNDRICGCGSRGCMETLVSQRGLFQSIQEQYAKKNAPAKFNWQAVIRHVNEHGLEPWLRRSLQAAAASIASAVNVMGLGKIVITGNPIDLTEELRAYLGAEIRRAALWGKFGELSVVFAPRRRMRGLVSVGIDRLLVESPAE